MFKLTQVEKDMGKDTDKNMSKDTDTDSDSDLATDMNTDMESEQFAKYPCSAICSPYSVVWITYDTPQHKVPNGAMEISVWGLKKRPVPEVMYSTYMEICFPYPKSGLRWCRHLKVLSSEF